MRLGVFALGRLIVYLRSISKSLATLADVEQKRLDIEVSRLPVKRPTQRAEIGVVDVTTLNKRWKESHFEP